MTTLTERLLDISRAPVLLVACDYDGTLAPIVLDPSQAMPDREALVALRSLAAMPHTHVAVISGRALSDLCSLIGQPEDIHLVGSHGSEFDLDFATALPPQAKALRERIRDELAELAKQVPGLRIEEKPGSVAFHYRGADAAEAEQAIAQVLDGPAAYEGVYTRYGKKVIELGVVATHKGDALETIRQRVGASAAIFIGDDRTDEDAFARLRGPDVGIKVGEGESLAEFRVGDTTDVARLLAQLSEMRSEWLAGAEAVAIADHAMLSDQRTAGLVTPDARLVWMCYPRIDSPPLFSELLGGPATGYFSICPADGSDPVRQDYIDHSLILQTQWERFTVTDYMDCSQERYSQRAGRSDLIRLIEGNGRVVIEFAPRPDFGRMDTRLQVRGDGIEIAGALDPVVLRAPGVEWKFITEGQHETAVAEIDLDDHDGRLVLELRCGTSRLREGIVSEEKRRRQTYEYWNKWVQRLRVPEEPELLPELVRRSALVLKGLTYGPTGAICAAVTTSLPEHFGGVRNWDYRYCWLRDAALSAASLVRLGSESEAMRLLDWVLGVLEHTPSPDRLHPLYTVTGSPLGPEAEIAEIAGYRGSRPVRVSNLASQQVQLDVFGPIVELVSMLTEQGAPLSSQHWRVVEAMVSAVQQRWMAPDHGIWEVRLPRRHHTHSKIMCWLTVDRALHIAEHTYDRQPEDWIGLRDEIALDILANGWCKEMNAFTASYGYRELDAAVLHVGLSGLLPPDDERFVKTVEAVDRHLRTGPAVYRYRYDDGLPGTEGAFHLCTSWLIESYILIGRLDDAQRLFHDMCNLVGMTGLLSEQYDPATRESLGNHPQAFSHLGIINTAVALSEALAQAGNVSA